MLVRILFFLVVLMAPLSFVCADSDPLACPKFEELKANYFPENKYNEFVEELGKLKNKDRQEACADYYKALARYHQLKYLEEKQLWDDYFAYGNSYREQLIESAEKTIRQVKSGDALKVKSLLLLWQFHHDQQDAFRDQSLIDLMQELNTYAKGPLSSQELIKETADKLSDYEEKSNARQAYKLYIDKLVAGNLNEEELKKTAGAFYKDGNLELAMGVFDIYAQKLISSLPKERLVPELFEIASLFVYKPQGLYDLAYAEKIYSKIEEAGSKQVFNQETMYLRAFNLEKLKDYEAALKRYAELTGIFPASPHHDEAVYKMGMISVYSQANLAEARKFLDLVAGKDSPNAYSFHSLYHLGLLAQWEGDIAGAKNYYDLLLQKAGSDYSTITAQAKARLKEIEENKPISHNLKTFLDLSLKKEALLESDQLDLAASSYILEKAQNFSASSSVNMPQSGCNQVQLQYLWSGDLGGAEPTTDESSFQAAYPDAGTKTIQLVVTSPTGAIDRSFIMTDVY